MMAGVYFLLPYLGLCDSLFRPRIAVSTEACVSEPMKKLRANSQKTKESYLFF